MRATSLLTGTILVLAATLASVPALDAAKPASCRPGNVFQNDDVRLWFHGAKGFVKVFDTNGTDDSGDTHFAYKTGEIVELDDANDTLARMNLERAYPQTSGCIIEETDEWVNMTLAVTDDVKSDAGNVGEATVEFAYHFNKTDHGAKFDLIVIDWPWQGDGELGYAFTVETSNGDLTPAENGIGYSDENGNPRGYVEWAANATATYSDGRNETAIVDSETAMDGTQHARVTLRFTNATAGYQRLDYDPWAGAGAWIVVGPLLVGLAPVEELLPASLVGTLRSLL